MSCGFIRPVRDKYCRSTTSAPTLWRLVGMSNCKGFRAGHETSLLRNPINLGVVFVFAEFGYAAYVLTRTIMVIVLLAHLRCSFTLTRLSADAGAACQSYIYAQGTHASGGRRGS